MAYSVLRKDGKIKDFIQGVKDKRASKNVKFTDVIENVRLEQGGGLKKEYAQYATLKNRPILGSTKIKYSVPRQEFKHGPNSKIWKSTSYSFKSNTRIISKSKRIREEIK